MNEIPMTYLEWNNQFEKLKTSVKDDIIIDNLNKGKLDLDENLLIRFMHNVDELVSFRLNNALDKFINSISMSGVNFNNFNMILLELKKEFKFLFKISKLNVIPIENQEKLISTLSEEIKKIELIILEKLGKTDRTGMLISAVKNSNLSNCEV